MVETTAQPRPSDRAGPDRPDTALPPSSPAPSTPSSTESALRIVVAALLIAVAAATTGVLSTRSISRLELIIPVGVLGVGLLIALAVKRFEWFVLAVLAIRTAADITKVRPDSNQLAAIAANAPSAASSGKAASVLAVLFIVFSGLWLALRRDAERGARPSTLDLAFVFFIVACLASVVGSVNRLASLTESARIVAAILMLFVLERLLTDLVRVKRVLCALLLALLPPLLLGAVQGITGSGRFETAGISRVVGSFLHPNTFGFFLDMFILMAVSLYRSCSTRMRIVLAGLLLVSGAMLLLTYSRGAWVALVVGVLVIGVLHSRRLALWTVGVIVVAAIAVPSVSGRLSDLSSSSNAGGTPSNSFVWRVDYWSQVSTLNHNNPVTGIGLKGTKYLTTAAKAPHNDFLRAYAETGVLGLLAFVIVILALIGAARTSLGRTTDGFSRGVAVGFSAVLAAYVVDSLGDNLMSEVVILWYFYAIAACAVAVGRISAADRG